MVDVGNKPTTSRHATATAVVNMTADSRKAIEGGAIKKGPVLEVARLAGIMAVKKTSDLIPLCHNINIESAKVDFQWVTDAEQSKKFPCDSADEQLLVTSSVQTEGKTGVEMEALMAASIAALTVYDMIKSLQRDVRIGPVELESKSGGVHGDYDRT